MKKYLFLFCFISYFSKAQSHVETCQLLQKVNTIIQNNHYKPKPVDDSLSVYVFETFLDKLDEDHRIFLKPEINFLEKYKFELDNAIVKQDCNFLDSFYNYYTTAIARKKEIITNLKHEKFNWKGTDTIYFSKKSFPFLQSQDKLYNATKKVISYEILQEIAETSTNKDSIIQHFESLSKKAIEKIFDAYECQYANIKLDYSSFEQLFVSTFCSYFDPHTDFFTQTSKSDFLSSVSSDNLSFGIIVSIDEKNEIVVDEVITGSNAYNTKKITSGDLLVKINVQNKEYNSTCSNRTIIEEILLSSEYKNADFTFRKKSGESYTVTLQKEILRDYNNAVYSLILPYNTKKYGYIKIPSFYSAQENGTTNTSDDVLSELVKLEKENIAGLVIDLQDNGGGAMNETLHLVEIFIDKGAIAAVQNRNKDVEIVKDEYPGMGYTGNLVVLINGFTASASEFFVNAIQDYKRGIVLGCNSYGKATMQSILPIDEESQNFVKITGDEFYRVTKKTNQYTGIQPDINLPYLFDSQIPREKSNKTAIQNDEISKKIKYTPYTINNYNTILEKSQYRITNNPAIKEITDIAQQLEALYNNSFPPVAVEINNVMQQTHDTNLLWKKIENLTKKEYLVEVAYTQKDKTKIKKNPFLKSVFEDNSKAAKQSIYLQEALEVLQSMQE